MDFVARGSSRQSMKLNLKNLMAGSALKRVSADEKKYFRKKKGQSDEILNSPLWYRFRVLIPGCWTGHGAGKGPRW
jgi:hypothetical protein